MLDFKGIENDLEEWEAGLKRRGAKVDLDKLVGLAGEYGDLLQKVEALRADKNATAKHKDIEAGKKIGKELEKLEKELAKLEAELDKESSEIPNLPLSDVPEGGEANGKVLGKNGEPVKIKHPKDHVELGKTLDIIDIERGAKTSGARFYYLKNQAVQLEFALVNYVLEILGKKGFDFLMGPQLLSEKVMMAGGYLGKAKDEVYKTQDDLYLAGTSEQSILGYHLDEIIDVPKRYASFSTCFRREAGSYGKDVKGIIRTHQFDKVEMFSFVTPEESEKEHEFLVGIQEEILRELEIPYQKVLLAGEDLSIASAKTIDLESWIPSQEKYRETHSCSNCTDWQARRGNIRYRSAGQRVSGSAGQSKTEFVHTLNGTAIAIGRLLAVFLENHQQEDGSVTIPKALQPYLGFKEIKR